MVVSAPLPSAAVNLSKYSLIRLGPYSDNQPIPLKYGTTTIGRAPDNEIQLESIIISGNHCSISVSSADKVQVVLTKKVIPHYFSCYALY